MLVSVQVGGGAPLTRSHYQCCRACKGAYGGAYMVGIDCRRSHIDLVRPKVEAAKRVSKLLSGSAPLSADSWRRRLSALGRSSMPRSRSRWAPSGEWLFRLSVHGHAGAVEFQSVGAEIRDWRLEIRDSL